MQPDGSSCRSLPSVPITRVGSVSRPAISTATAKPRSLRERSPRRHGFARLKAAYDWAGAGMNVALATRIGLPIAADPRTIRLTARQRVRVIVARFHDAAGTSGSGLRAAIDWGDGTSWNGKVLSRGGGIYDIRS